MVFDTGIYDGVKKMRASTLLGEIVRLHQRTKDPLKYVHTNSEYGNLVSIPASYFSRAGRYKGWVEGIILHW